MLADRWTIIRWSDRVAAVALYAALALLFAWVLSLFGNWINMPMG